MTRRWGKPQRCWGYWFWPHQWSRRRSYNSNYDAMECERCHAIRLLARAGSSQEADQ